MTNGEFGKLCDGVAGCCEMLAKQTRGMDPEHQVQYDKRSAHEMSLTLLELTAAIIKAGE